MVDLPLLAFRERIATSPIKCDLLALFGTSPTESFTAGQAAFQIRRPVRVVQLELQDLTLLHILVPVPRDGETEYYLTADPELREMAVRYAATRAQHAPPPRRRFTA